MCFSLNKYRLTAALSEQYFCTTQYGLKLNPKAPLRRDPKGLQQSSPELGRRPFDTTLQGEDDLGNDNLQTTAFL